MKGGLSLVEEVAELRPEYRVICKMLHVELHQSEYDVLHFYRAMVTQLRLISLLCGRMDGGSKEGIRLRERKVPQVLRWRSSLGASALFA